jgi:hypothetical protein
MASKKMALPPKIGVQWACEGGIYAGVVRGHADGEPDCYLILYGYLESSQGWQTAKNWAASVGVKHQYRLATKAEHSILRGNVADQIFKAIFWAADEHSLDGAFAWVTNFDSGSQNCALKRTPEACALAVRTIPVRA